MLDLSDLTLHWPSDHHMVTRCGLRMMNCKVGPEPRLRNDARRLCTSCYGPAMSTTEPEPVEEAAPAEEAAPVDYPGEAGDRGQDWQAEPAEPAEEAEVDDAGEDDVEE